MKRNNFKPAFVDQILFWFFLIALTIGFVATVSDNEDSRVKYQDLKSITDRAALSAAKYYTLNYINSPDDTTGKSESATIADNIVKTNMDPLAQSVSISYTWDFSALPYSVIATIADHTHTTFWWRFFGLDEHEMDNVQSKAELGVSTDPRCVCAGTNGVDIVGRTLCVVGTQSDEQTQISDDGNSWKVKAVFDNGSWEEEEWYAKSAVDNIIEVMFNGDDQVQLGAVNIPVLVDAGCGDDQIQGGIGPDTIHGNKGNDQIEGKEGDDILYGGDGDDQIQGGNDNDTLYRDGSDSTVDPGGQGGDTIAYDTGYSDNDCNGGSANFDCQGNVVLVY